MGRGRGEKMDGKIEGERWRRERVIRVWKEPQVLKGEEDSVAHEERPKCVYRSHYVIFRH